MKKIKFYIISLIVILLLSGCNSVIEDEKTINYIKNKSSLECIYFSEEDFVNIKQFETKHKIDGEIKGGIIPHHLLAKDIIHEFFRTVQSNKYDLIVLIGPDHKSKDGKRVLTTLKDWQTPFGVLETDKEITKDLINKNILTKEDDKMEKEHSVASLVSFVKYYFPDCKVVSAALSCYLDMKDIKVLSDSIYEEIKDRRVLIIASVDFSHYLSYEEANKKDKITKQALLDRDIRKIYSFTNDNMDSPETIITLLNIMKELKFNKETILRNLNSFDIVKKSNEGTTSYFSVVYYK